MAVMFERFTDRARKVMALANQEAQRFNHEYITPEHILLGLVKDWESVAGRALAGMGVDPRKIRLEVEMAVKSGDGSFVVSGQRPASSLAKKAVEYAIEEARGLNHRHVGTDHILLGLLRLTEGVAARVFADCGVTLDGARNYCKTVCGYGPEPGTTAKPL